MQGVLHALLVLGGQRLVECGQHLEGGLAVEFAEDVFLAGRHRQRRADGAAALGDDGIDLDIALERHADQARAVQLAVEEERVALDDRGQAADLRGVGKGVVDAGEQGPWVAGWRADWVGEQNEICLLTAGHAEGGLPGFGALVGAGQGVEVEGVEIDIGQPGDRQRDGGLVLDLARAPDDADCGATDKGARGKIGADPFGDMCETVAVLGRDEGADQVGLGAIELFANRPLEFGEGGGRLGLSGYGGGPSHRGVYKHNSRGYSTLSMEERA